MLFETIKLSLLASLACAAAIPPQSSSSILARDGDAAQKILAIAKSSGTCDGAKEPSECRTNVQAAPHLIAAFQKYDIYDTAEMAAVISLIAYESADFKFNTNHYPGNPGQGTRNMMMPNYVYKYVQSIPELASKLAAIPGSGGTSKDSVNLVLALVLPDEYSFASGAWFLATECGEPVRSKIRSGPSDVAFNALMGCIGITAPDQKRKDYWQNAVDAFSVYR